MKTIIYTSILALLSSLLYNCKSDNKEQYKSENKIEQVNALFDSIDQNFLEQESGKLGVLVKVDSFGVFKDQTQELLPIDAKIPDSYKNVLLELNKSFNLEGLILENIEKLLKQNKKDFVVLKNSEDQNYMNLIKKNSLNNILKVHVKSGIAQKQENQDLNDLPAGQTYVNIELYDGKSTKPSYEEKIGGTQFVDNTNKIIDDKELKKAIVESINQTFSNVKN